LQLGDLLVVNAYKTLLYETNIVQVHTITSDIAESAADIRVRYNIKTPDALHIATAINTQCDVFVTNDYQLTRIKELRVVILDEIEL
jgi:predicted nucleic acid-binding protein